MSNKLKSRRVQRRAPVACSAPRVRVVEATGNWMVYDGKLKRMLCLCTQEHDAHLICAALRVILSQNKEIT